MKPILRPSRREGGTLAIALLTVAVLAAIAACVLSTVSSHMRTAQTSAAWKEALTTAESAVDMTVADLTGLLPDVRLDASEGLAIGTSQLPLDLVTRLGVGSNGLNLAQGITLSYKPAALTHGGEGSGRQEATVFIDVMPLSQLLQGGTLSLGGLSGLLSDPLSALNGADMQLIHLRARGVVPLSGGARVDQDSLDARLRRPSLVWDRLNGGRVSRAQVTREVEVLLKPVFPYQSAVTSAGRFRAESTDAVFDSFNSALPLTSTAGRYDVTKRLLNGDVFVDNSEVALAGRVFGSVRTDHGGVEKSERITGMVDNNFSQPLPLIRKPTWQGSPLAPGSITGATTLPGGTLGIPTRYKFDRVTAPLRITRGLLPVDSAVEIWIQHDFTGSLTIDPGVRAKVYVEGNVDLPNGSLVNGSNRASNLQFFGIPAGTGTETPVIRLGLGTTEVCAAIYAPTHRLELNGAGHFTGAITAASFQATGAAQVHYDESLALSVGPILRFAVASWVEKDL
jgi:hypothetical protein